MIKNYFQYIKENSSKLQQAAEFINKYGIISSPDLRYITHPLYAYISYKYIDKIKEFGVKYRFSPIYDINFGGVLSRFIKEKGHVNTLFNNRLKLYNYKLYNFGDEYSMSKEDLLIIKNHISDILSEFNNKIGTEYYIKKSIGRETSSSIERGILNKLSNNFSEKEKRYKDIEFVLDRYKEDEYLAIIPMDNINKPKMS